MSLNLHDVRLTVPDGLEERVILDGLDLSVDPGEVVVIVGPSGSGKSSLLAVAGLLRRPAGGRVVLGGRDVTEASDRVRASIRRSDLGFVFQQSNLLAALTAADQLRAAAHLAGQRPSDRRIGERVDDLLTSVGMDSAADRRPHQLSGGERQRVGIARALMNDPSVLLVDEPTSALDPERGAQVMDLLVDLSRSRRVATLVVTHDHALLARADRVVEMRAGQLV